MTHINIPVSKWAAIGGAILVGWQLLGNADSALIKHLDSTFATKADIQRIEEKIDLMLLRPYAPPGVTPSKK